MAQDAAQALANNAKVLLENDDVRIYEFRAKLGAKIAMHPHPCTAPSLSDSTSTFTDADGKPQVTECKAGQAFSDPAMTHWPENSGNMAYLIALEIAKQALGATSGPKLDRHRWLEAVPSLVSCRSYQAAGSWVSLPIPLPRLAGVLASGFAACP